MPDPGLGSHRLLARRETREGLRVGHARSRYGQDRHQQSTPGSPTHRRGHHLTLCR